MTGRILKQNNDFRLPVISKIKIGEKRISEKTGKEYPVSLDYFKPVGKYESLFLKAFPENTNKIPILFISDDISFCCNERLELRDSKGDLYGKSDGETFYIWDEKEKMYKPFLKSDIPDIESRTETKTGKKWQRILTLRFIIPAIKGVLGLWQLDTKADKSSIDQIRDTYDYILSKAGTVTRILFDLTVTKVKSQQPGNPSTYAVLNLIPNVSDENLTQLKEYFESGVTNSMRYITDETLLQLETNQKQLSENIEVVQGKNIEVVKDTNLFNY